MATSYMDYASPTAQFAYSLQDSVTFKKNDQNYFSTLSINQLNTLGNVSLLDIFLSQGNMIEPHIHQNSSELVYCVSGAAVVSILNPFTKKLLNFTIGPGQVANVPQGWWHYEIATHHDTHLMAIFDAPIPEVIFGSDMLRLTPPSVFAHAYCLDESKVKEALEPITSTVIIGPPEGCDKRQSIPVRTSQQDQYSYYQDIPVGSHYHPFRPIMNEAFNVLPEQPFYPIPFLYQRSPSS